MPDLRRAKRLAARRVQVQHGRTVVVGEKVTQIGEVDAGRTSPGSGVCNDAVGDNLMKDPRSLLVLLVLCAAVVLQTVPALAESASEQEGTARKRVLIVTGMDFPGHKWRETAPVLAEGLRQDARLDVRVVEDPRFLASPELDTYDAVVLHFMDWEQPDPGPEARAGLQAFVENGGGMTVVHFACGAFQEWPEFRNLAGRAWDPELRGHDPYGAFRVDIVAPDHPITKGMPSFETVDELYTCLAGDRPVEILATARSKVDDKDYPMAFVFPYGKGRVFHSPLGHDVQAYQNAGAMELIRRGCAWTAGLEPVTDSRKIVFIAGTPSHAKGEHDWDKDATLLKESLDASPNAGTFETSIHFDGWPKDPDALAGADAIVLLSDGLEGHPLAQPARLEQMRTLVEDGCGLVCIHYAVAAAPGAEPEFLEWIGGYWEKGYSMNPMNTTEVVPGAPEHPICRGWKPFTARDEFYFRIRFRENDDRLVPIATAMLPKDAPAKETIAWAVERKDGGRGFGFTGAHFHKNWRIEPFRKMVLNAIVWAARAAVPEDGVESVVE